MPSTYNAETLSTKICKTLSVISTTGYESKSNPKMTQRISDLIPAATPTKKPPSSSDRNNTCEISNNLTPSISQRLGNCPSDFLTAYNPDRANNIIAKGYTPGEVAMLPDTPTLADVSAKFDEATAIKWLTIQIDSADIIGGTKAFPEEARYSLASLLLAAYGYLNIGEFLLFFARYRLGDYTDLPVGGLQKISAALRRYVDNRNLDIRRIEREQYNRQQEAMRREWAAKAISYEEYLNTKDQ